MRIAFVQYDITWESPAENRLKIEGLLSSQIKSFDLLVLPEMFTTGFSMNTTKNAEKPGGETLRWMYKIADKHQATVTGSIIVEEDGEYYNRLYWVRPDVSHEHYDKKHLFTLAKEDRYFKAGKTKKVFEMDVDGVQWKICPLICYDLRFPVWSRNVEDYDLLIYVANFPKKRQFAWSQLLIARAIENQSYVVGVNRIGSDGVDIPYSGNSVVLDYEGRNMVDAASTEGVFYVNVSMEKLMAYRRAYAFLRDRDHFAFTENAD